MKNIAILILAHKELDYFFLLAKDNPNIYFFIHYDIKSKIPSYINHNNNIFFIDERVDVKWGGFSQVRAMLNLFNFALNFSEIQFFHLISGQDTILSNNKNLSKHLTWDSEEIFMELRHSEKHAYRVRFNAFHAEKYWQRNILGKIFTLYLKFLHKICPSKENFWFGSNWFSIKRIDLEKLICNVSSLDLSKFENKLNPDEHFFQYLVVKSRLQHKISPLSNHRYIVFDKSFNNGNNPIYQDVFTCIKELNKFFFIRKCDVKTQVEFYSMVNKK